jgi:predicted dehydrogenase
MHHNLMSSPTAPSSNTAEIARVRIGVVGLNFGRHVLGELTRAPAKKYAELAAVCDLDAAKAGEMAARYRIPATTSLDELLADPSIEAIGLFTGPIGRAALIRRIIRAGKHVMTTKPFELDPAAAADVLAEADKRGRIVHLNSPGPHLPGDLRQVLAWQEKFSLGRPIACRREVWVSYREQADGTWYDDPKLCPVAPIFRLGIYLINDMIRLFGPAQAVQVMHSRIFTGRPTPDNAQLTIQFSTGVIGSIFASFCVDDGQFYANTMTLNYERGTIFRNVGPQADRQAAASSKMAVVAKVDSKQSVIEYADPGDLTGSYQWQAFHSAIRFGKSADEVAADDIVAGIHVIKAMMKSEQTGAMEAVG